MAAKHIAISPLTRIEGHLAVHAEVETSAEGVSRVTSAQCEGEMFRGFEQILSGRDPLDAQQITQRICGVCPISHGIASVQAQEMAYGIEPSHDGRLLQNLILAANYIQSHIVHFYQLAALDFVDIKAILSYDGNDRTLKSLRDWAANAVNRGDSFAGAPFLPRYEVPYLQGKELNWSLLGSYVKALEMRAIAHEAAAVFGAKLPHSTSLVPGGVTQIPTIERILAYRSRLDKLMAFIQDVYIPDLKQVAAAAPQFFDIGKGYNNFLVYGVFRTNSSGSKWIESGVVIDGQWQPFDQHKIAEQIGYSRFSSGSNLHPSRGASVPDPDKQRAYTWLKAPRYNGQPVEVGPLARIMVNYHKPGGSWIRTEVDSVLGSLGLPVEKLHSVLGRHLIRGLECLWIGRKAYEWLDEVEINGAPANDDYQIPKSATGYGLTEAPRGALGHWINIRDYKISNYQCVVPTTWNCSPKGDNGDAGPIEKSLEGLAVADPSQPIEAARVVRSFDPCLACAVH